MIGRTAQQGTTDLEKELGAKIVGQVSLQVVEVSPAQAQKWLDERNKSNRPLRSAKVDTYAEQMKQGRWRSDREPIEFGQDGTLKNGQHRLHAIVQSGCTIRIPIRGNVSNADVVVMDTGLSRVAADVLSMGGYKNATQLAAAAKLVHLWRTKPSMTMLRSGAKTINNELIEQVVFANGGLVDSVEFAKHLAGHFNLIPPSAVAAMHYEVKNKYGQDVANEFFEHLAYGHDLSEGSPILALRNVLLKSQTAYQKPPTELRMAWTLHAFNKWRSGANNVKLIKHVKSASFPTI